MTTMIHESEGVTYVARDGGLFAPATVLAPVGAFDWITPQPPSTDPQALELGSKFTMQGDLWLPPKSSGSLIDDYIKSWVGAHSGIGAAKLMPYFDTQITFETDYSAPPPPYAWFGDAFSKPITLAGSMDFTFTGNLDGMFSYLTKSPADFKVEAPGLVDKDWSAKPYEQMSQREKFIYDLGKMADSRGLKKLRVEAPINKDALAISVTARCRHDQKVGQMVAMQALEQASVPILADMVISGLLDECKGFHVDKPKPMGGYFSVPTWISGPVTFTFDSAYGVSTTTSHPVLGPLLELFPVLNEYEGKCPACDEFTNKLSGVIIHLNDHHKWKREHVADWLEILPIDLTIQPKKGGGDAEVEAA